jgi:hypothetical protein
MPSQRLHSYRRHLARLDRHLEQMDTQNRQLSWWRLGIFLAGGFSTYLAYSLIGTWPGHITGFVFLTAFTFTVYRHRHLDRTRLLFQTTRQITMTQIARMQLDWAQIPWVEKHPDDTHPLARDLNLTGERSLHQLLNTAFSQGGANRLRMWLLTSAEAPDPVQIQARHVILRELIPRIGLRTRLTRSSALVTQPGETWDGEKLLHWLEGHSNPGSRTWLIFLFLLAFGNTILLILSATGRLPAYWLATTALYFLIYVSLARNDTFTDALTLSQSLTQFRAVFTLLETTPFHSGGKLTELCTPFTTGDRPSRLLRRVNWIASAASLQRNLFLWLPLNLLVPWDLFFSHLLSQQKDRLHTHLPRWLEVWYELEALNSLANFAALNPDTIFPEILSTPTTEPILQTCSIGHPLLPADVGVRNDFTLHHLGELVIVTGSNMSGKSTFLRILGINLVLAFAGGPVLANCLRVIPMRLCTSIQVSDSLSDGISYFYAEVKRLKTLLDALREDHPTPLFFLIDEIFRGTNNQERRIGSDAYIRALAGGNGTGVISTHDLELTRLADEISGIFNYHFREDILDGRMVFDYHLRSGPSPTTNALRIMALEGLLVNIGSETT